MGLRLVQRSTLGRPGLCGRQNGRRIGRLGSGSAPEVVFRQEPRAASRRAVHAGCCARLATAVARASRKATAASWMASRSVSARSLTIRGDGVGVDRVDRGSRPARRAGHGPPPPAPGPADVASERANSSEGVRLLSLSSRSRSRSLKLVRSLFAARRACTRSLPEVLTIAWMLPGTAMSGRGKVRFMSFARPTSDLTACSTAESNIVVGRKAEVAQQLARPESSQRA